MENLKKKCLYPVSEDLDRYLKAYGRSVKLPLKYHQLMDFKESVSLYDKDGNDTLWLTFVYEPMVWQEINHALTRIYAQLMTPGNTAIARHLRCDRVDFCAFGNSQPFRIRIVNNFNDNHDYFYVKRADASRVYGLEIEDLLSPNNVNFLVDGDTLIEQHIIGIPGDQFIRDYFAREDVNKIRVAKEFVKFNERCGLRLLGDMRSYNFVIQMTPDFDDRQYRVRAIDFDQQCFEARYRFYLPQFFKDNRVVVELCLSQLEPESIEQYRDEERSLMARRGNTSARRLSSLRQCMTRDTLSTPDRIHQLAQDLAQVHKDPAFASLATMGDLMFRNIDRNLESVGGINYNA